MKRLLFWLSGHLPCRLINGGDGSRTKMAPYLERYFLATLLGCYVYVHRFVGSDPDVGLHDHPFMWSFSLILAGSYVEVTVRGFSENGFIIKTHRFRPCMLNLIGPYKVHRVVADRGEAWTLFVHGPRVKSWGFLRPAGEYLKFTKHPTLGDPNDPWWETTPRGRDSDREPVST
jgi:hypothetical protein